MLLQVNPFKVSLVAGVVSNQSIPVEEYLKELGSEKK